MTGQPIRLVVGLGNPGTQYEATRHNVGFWFVDALARREGLQFRVESRFQGLLARLTLDGSDLRLLKPTTFMNRSGQSVAAVARYFELPPEAVLVAHDELDLPAGAVRLKKGGGHAGHNGLRDIVKVLGTRDFWRLRIGIDRPQDRAQVVNYVLSRAPREAERLVLDALDEAERCLPDVVAGDVQKAMNRLHSRR
jgi:PTH1 family peptidyl-tRNA hydrolase